MAEQHPLTPPPKLVQKWYIHNRKYTSFEDFWYYFAAQAAQWGWDQREPEIQADVDAELEACVQTLEDQGWHNVAADLRAARRPKPPTLNSIALQMLGTIERDAHYLPEITDTIRKALEQLDD
jgi:hypothetical protein